MNSRVWGGAGVTGFPALIFFFLKGPDAELDRIFLAPGKTSGGTSRGNRASGSVRARLNVVVALQESISWEEGWRSCIAAQGTNCEHKCLCSAPQGVAKYPNLAASAQELFLMYSVPLFPNRSVWVGILRPLRSWARSMVLMLGAAGIGLQLSAAP